MTATTAHPHAHIRIAIFGALVLVASLLAANSATAHTLVSLSGSDFQIETDANLKVESDHGPASKDWANVAEERQEELDSGTGDNAFGQGTKEDSPVPSVVSGSIPPNKSDLKYFGVYQEGTTSSGFLHLFWSRVQDPSGTTNMDFEFNARHCTPAQSPPDADCTTNGITPIRTPGDLLITYDLANGGTNAVMGKRTWTPSGWSSYAPFGSDAVGTVNTDTIPVGDSDGLGPHSPRTFGEASIRLSAILPPSGCPGFGSAYLKSRSSDSFTAALKDFITPIAVTISNCGSINITKEDDAGARLGGATFTLYNDLDPTGTSRVSEDTATSFTCTTSGSGTCTISNVPFGNYWVVETTTPNGHTTAPDRKAAISSSVTSVSLTFVNPRKFKVIVLVCKEADDSLYASNVTLPSGSSTPADTKKSLSSSTSPSAAALCGLGGASFGALPQGLAQVSVDIGTAPVP